MNDLDVVRDFRTDTPPAGPEALSRARWALLREMHEPAGRGRRPGNRRAWLMATGLAAALAAAGVLVIAHGPATPDTQGPTADAATVLRQAALAAEHEQIVPARPDQYVFIESVENYRGETFDCDGKADQSHCTAQRDPASRRLRQVWLPVDGAHDGLLRDRPEQGSAAWNETPLPACQPDTSGVSRSPGTQSANQPVAVCGASGAYLVDAPTDPTAMTEYLRKKASQPAGEAELFTAAGDLIRETYVPPASLAALFRAVAAIPGITVVQDAVDAAGRHGISVGIDGHGYRNELIFDRTTFAYLGSRAVALQDSGAVKKGTVDGQSAQLRIAIVDRLRQVP